MVFFISCPNRLSFLKDLTFRPIFTTFPFVGTKNLAYLNLQRSHFGFVRFIVKNPSLICFCKVGSESERELELEMELEGEILEFMKWSKKPGHFPTKAELVEAGRRDLVDAVFRRGGWLSMGWDLEGYEGEFDTIGDENDTIVEENGAMGDENDTIVEENGTMGDEKGAIVEENGTMGDANGTIVGSDESVERFERDSSWGLTSFSQSPTFSRRSLDMVDEEEETGVQGILSRLEKERNLSFTLDLVGQPLGRYSSDDWLLEASGDVEDCDQLKRSRGLSSGISNESMITNSGGNFSPSKSLADIDGSWSSSEPEPEPVKTWTIERDSFSTAEFEGTFIQIYVADDAPKDDKVVISECSSEVLDENRINGHDDIRSRLQHLEHELSYTLSSLRSKREKLTPKEGYGTSTDMHKLSDALEFEETEIMNAKDSLRSIRAKLAVLEGKMTLAIIGARKAIDEKQMKIDSARRALHFLRTTSIVWPNSASEVFLVGSFDGWTTQRRMKKSSTGIFSVELKLYPGKYEIKFVVDGVWKVDPLRPIVKNNGYENNLFIVL